MHQLAKNLDRRLTDIQSEMIALFVAAKNGSIYYRPEDANKLDDYGLMAKWDYPDSVPE